jgi:uncharacterized membrane protein YfcA
VSAFALPALAGWQWALGALCAFFVGVAKTGVPGLGIFVVPLMVLAVGDARHAAGWLLPLLSTADLFAVVYYRRHAQAWRLFSLAPSVVAGMIGGAFALGGSEPVLRRVVGLLVLAMIAVHVARKRRASTAASATSVAAPADGVVQAAGYGVVAGFATMVANAAGPVMNAYLLAKRLPKEEFIATGAWFFLVINLSKVPVYAGRGLMDGRSLAFDLALAPAVVAGALCGRRLFGAIPQRAFEIVVLLLTAIAAALLLLS